LAQKQARVKIHSRLHVTFWHLPRYSIVQLKQVPTNYAELGDSALAEQSRAGEPDAFAECYRHYLTPV
jgi:hypothetical protein